MVKRPGFQRIQPEKTNNVRKALSAANRFVESALQKVLPDRARSKAPRYVASYNPSRTGYTEVDHHQVDNINGQQIGAAAQHSSPVQPEDVLSTMEFKNGLQALAKERPPLEEKIDKWNLQMPDLKGAAEARARSDLHDTARSRDSHIR